MTCGEAIIKLLEAYEVDTVFGIPGVHNLELYRGLTSSSIRHVLTRHEQGAGFMADGYARASGKPGICFVISGPGVTNITTPLGQAYSDSIPMLLISSDAPSETLGKGWGYLHEVTDLTAVTRPLTAFSQTVKSPEEVPGALARAFEVFCSERPRPVHIAVPLDILALSVTESWQVQNRVKQAMPEAELAEAAQLLNGAKKPLIIAGGGAARSGAKDEVLELAKRLNAPVAYTSSGKGILPEAHLLCLGSVIYGEVQQAISDADLVLALGTELADPDCFSGHYKVTDKLIHIDIDPHNLGNYFETELGIVADVKDALEYLLPLVAKKRGDETVKTPELMSKIRANLSDLEHQHETLLLALREALPLDAIFTADMTQLAYSAIGLLPINQPNCWFYPAGYGTLGYAFPAAVGAKFAQPSRDLIVLVGDAGFQYTLQELGTAVEHNLSLTIILWNNGGLGEIERSMQVTGIEPTQVNPHNPDFLALARAYGADAGCPQTREAFIEAVRQSQQKDKPTLIEVRQGSSWLL
ncbi:MAG: 5-guanidino-2-oxopentanoate decarboxylase [Trueperaceae bacterium]|nr:5-guanidino-2-oxopentanoate decarboxylase [Trueperaceae bacterium]